MSDAARSEARRLHGVACPECVAKLPKACPTILLPEQRCKIHGYRDPRKRTYETEYMHRVEAVEAQR